MKKMNVTESNFLGLLITKKFIAKSEVSMAGRYHVALQGLCRLGFAVLETPKPGMVGVAKYIPTPAGIAAHATTTRHEDGADRRSKMKYKAR